MVPIASGEAEPTFEGIAWILAKAFLFFLSIIVAHKIVLPDFVTEGFLSYIPIARYYGIRHALMFNQGEQATLISLTFGLFFGMVAVWFGFHPAIGAYMSGLILEEEYFDIDDGGNTFQHTLHFIENAAYCWLGPVFFLNLGASIIIDLDILSNVIWYSVILYIGLYVGQFCSAALAARYVPGGFTWAESAMIGFGMLGRAELFFVVLNLCHVENDIMPKEMFYTFTFAAMFLNMSVPVSITLFKPYYMRAKKNQKMQKKADGQLPQRQTTMNFIASNNPLARMMRRKANKDEEAAERRIFTTSTSTNGVNGTSTIDDSVPKGDRPPTPEVADSVPNDDRPQILEGAGSQPPNDDRPQTLREASTPGKDDLVTQCSPPGAVDVEDVS
jgi:hypothetical protein